MKAAELKNKSKKELSEMVIALLQEQFQLRMKKGVTESPKTHLFKKIRTDIARIKTVLREAV
jgi:large subunit ribosomal protein L29